MVSSLGSQLSLARFAFNIYGSMGSEPPRPPRPDGPRPGHRLRFACEREVACLSQLQYPLASGSEPSLPAPLLHVVLGGKNYLKLLVLNASHTAVVADVNLVERQPRAHQKLFNVNTVKCHGPSVACGLVSGAVHLYTVAPSGKARLTYKLHDHKRVVNSVDFAGHDQLLVSGSQDGCIKVWDLRLYAPRPVALLALASHSDPVRLCECLPHAKVRGKLTVLLAHDSGALCKFDLRYPSSASAAALPERKWTFHTGPALLLHIHPEPEYVLTAGRDRKVCAWNYGESAAHSVVPELVVATYSPVMKVRWSPIPADDRALDADLLDPDDLLDRAPALYAYDFACSYLNDDPTVSVYNLRRKYIPKEIVTSSLGKPMQNFVWARNPLRHRKLWCITKANVFVSYNLDDLQMPNVARPVESLPPVASAWTPGYANLAFVSQHSADFSAISDHPSPDVDSNDSFNDDVSRPDDSYPEPFVYGSPAGVTPPKDRPPISRQNTQFTIKSLTPALHPRPTTDFMPLPPVRPGLHRNSSQTTQDSQSHGQSHAHLSKKSIAALSPYIVTLPVPIPLADDTVFDILANEYHISIPDGFSLWEVCHLNARIAATVLRLRDCEVWRMLAVVLEQESLTIHSPEPHIPIEQLTVYDSDNVDHEAESKSISSYLGNFVGSYNSNSTLTTNYGSAPRRRDSSTSMNKASFLSSSKDSVRPYIPMVVESRPGQDTFASKTGASATTSDNVTMSGSHSPLNHDRKDSLLTNNEACITGAERSDLACSSLESASALHKKPSQATIGSQKLKAIDIKTSHRKHPFTTASPDIVDDHESLLKTTVRSSPARNSFPSRQSWPAQNRATDLDNENLAVLGSVASYSSSGPLGTADKFSSVGNSLHSGSRMRPSFLSYRSSLNSGKSSFNASKSGFTNQQPQIASALLEKVDEFSIGSTEPKASELTKAMHRSDVSSEISKELSMWPWSPINMLEKAIKYANEQGDLIMCSTLILLFHDSFDTIFADTILSDEGCLECLGLYIETLRKKCLFNNAVSVVKEAPSRFKYKLSLFASKDVDMRYYCCWCEKLLVNETSKDKYGPTSEKFGYWYCDNCSRMQLCCVYCNEPSRGLNVVVGLNCGHRGHFGCLQEWFVDEGNTDCPGGCNYMT